MTICVNPPCSEAEPFRYCPVKDCGWMEDDNDRVRNAIAATEWTEDVEVKNALLHLVEGLTGRKAEPYDVAFAAGSLMGDGFKLVKAPDA